MLDNLEAQEQALMAMFVGTTSTWTDVATFNILPEDDINRMVIARISAIDGIVDANDLSGAPVYLNLKVTQRGQLPLNDKGEELPFPKNGFAYCIPGTAQITVTYDGRAYFDADKEIANFAVVYGLAPNPCTARNAPSLVIFSPAPGPTPPQGPASEQ